MILNIGKYNVNETPHRFSYNPDDNYWYQARHVEDFEPKAKPLELEKFFFKTTLGCLDKSVEANEQDFNDFVAYYNGIDNGATEYTVTLSEFPLAEDLKIVLEFWNFQELELFADKVQQGESITRYCDKISAVKFYAWRKDNNKVRFAIQKYKPITGDYNKDFVFIYDVLVDRTQLVCEIKNFINEFFYKRITDSFKQYEKENNVQFTNPRKHLDLAYILKYNYEELSAELEDEQKLERKNKADDKKDSKKQLLSYKSWTAPKYITATDLEGFINDLKPKIIGLPVNKILITGYLYDYLDVERITEIDGKYYNIAEWCGCDEDGYSIGDFNPDCEVDESEIHKPDGTMDEYTAELDEPAIIQIGDDIQFEIDFQEHSLAQIGINTLKEGELISDINCKNTWRDISGFYVKNIIGHKVKDLYISKTAQPSVTWQVERNQGDDMYDEIGIIFDNGYKLIFEVDTDYMAVSEVAPTKEFNS